MKQNKSKLKRQVRQRYKQHAKDANDIFELNSPIGVSCLDSALQERLDVILHKYREYGLDSEKTILGVLPYAVSMLKKIENLEFNMPLKNLLKDNTKKLPFAEILRIEEEFGLSNVFEELYGSQIPLNNLRLKNQIRLMNAELAINKESIIDLGFDLPEFLVQSKDYINYTYFIKRAALVIDLYNKLLRQMKINNIPNLTENEVEKINKELLYREDFKNVAKYELPKLLSVDKIQDIKVEIDYLHDLRYIPVVSIVVILKSEKESKDMAISKCRFRILPVIPESSKLNKDSISIYRNSVRKSILNYDTFNYGQDNLNSCFLPPTPQYNGAILSDTKSQMLKLSIITEEILSSVMLEETLMLLKLWCIKWKIFNHLKVNNQFKLSGQFNEEVLLYLLFHTLELNRDALNSRKTSSFQIFKLVLMTLQKMISNWKFQNKDQSGTYYVFGDSSPKFHDRIFLKDKDFKKTNLLHLFNRDYIGNQIFILTDKEEEVYNVFWRCQDLVKEELLDILNKTLGLIDNKAIIGYAETVSDMFSLGTDFDNKIRVQSHDHNKKLNDIPQMLSLLEFDSCIMISYPNCFHNIQLSYLVPPNNNIPKEISLGENSNSKTIKRNFDSIWENCQSSNLVEITRRILLRSFTDRVKNLNFREIISKEKFGCIIGIKFASKITRSIDKGPFVDSVEAKQFKDFWGSNIIETRRFRDGTVLETVVWNNENNSNSEFLTNKGINEDILRYTLNRHLPKITIQSELGTELKDGLVTYSMTPFGSINPYLSWEKIVHEEFSNFKSIITGLTSLPLSIKSIQSPSSILRFMKFYTSLNSSIDQENRFKEEIQCVIEMEQSNKWPKTKESIQKIKIAFLLSIQKELGELHSITCDIIPEYDHIEGTDNPDLRGFAPFLDVYWKGDITFRLSIFHPTELEQIAKTTIEPENMSEKVVEENIRFSGEDINQLRNLWWKTQIGAKLLNLSNYFPSLRETVKKLKHFASVNKIPDSEEFLEHVAAYVYTNNDLMNSIYGVPDTSTTGFLRSLWLISRYEWEKKPLVVDLDFQMTEDSEMKRISIEEFEKLDRIHSIYYNYIKKHKLFKNFFYVSSQYDPQSLLIKLPSHYNSSRLVHFANLYINIIVEKNSFNIPIKEIKSSFMTQPKNDIIIHLQQDYIGLIQPQSKKIKFNVLSLKKQYVNLNSTQELLSNCNIKASPYNVAREIFESFVLEVKSLWNQQVDLIYDPYILPYPSKIYLKVRTSQFFPSKITESQKKNFLPGCIISYSNSESETCNVFTIPNLPLILSTIWSRYSGFITNIQL
ncbi:NRAP like nucleolar RNA associated protein [Cryptosporidium ubiquitum]|uniref:NRAP like nucleolar RNA associated protein n=1 Tax=Cryptosporidium ubiquitum TaxID=857276 RepID=A0A1J4MIC0_9CRYT|nr:NRAP like nucleolar RNA associated protein [Cryptosporidium ubiquitum]OII72597.1 NRAP like nucleolar RNA associated protein [Cryptosporidium ubiquitum]